MPVSRYPDWESFEIRTAGDGPVAFGADLSPASVLGAYRRGVIPFPADGEYFRTLNEIRYEDQVASGSIGLVGSDRDDPYWVAWWSPDPRPVISADRIHIGRNMRKQLRRTHLWTTANTRFGEVAEQCRAGREPRWLTDALLAALTELHARGWAHSIEVWLEGDLAGGAMGIGLGGIISGDSLFGRQPGAAAIAVADMAMRLRQAGGALIDAQWDSPFMRSLGAELMPRERFLPLLAQPAATEPTMLPGERLTARRLLAGSAEVAAGHAGAGHGM